jgi:hypothetical protein
MAELIDISTPEKRLEREMIVILRRVNKFDNDPVKDELSEHINEILNLIGYEGGNE